MPRNKPGLADLKKLRQQAQPQDPPPSSSRLARAARKRAPFLPPSPSSATPVAASATGGAQAPDRRKNKPAPTPAIPPADLPAVSPLTEADRKLFRQAVRHVEQMKDPGRILLAPTSVAHADILKERRLRAAGVDTAKLGRKSAAADAAEAPRTTAGARKNAKRLSDNYASAAHDQDDSRYLKAGHGPDVLRDLKRGKWMIGASLDLHGSTLDDARERFERFLSSCLSHDVKCVRIVHGKGYGSPNGDAVLKTTVRRWLTQLDEVIAYTECAENEGGSGAVQVLLT